jgi:hypothetical protein
MRHVESSNETSIKSSKLHRNTFLKPELLLPRAYDENVHNKRRHFIIRATRDDSARPEDVRWLESLTTVVKPIIFDGCLVL